MKTFYINKIANNHVNEYTNGDGEHYSDLISYTTRVASYNHLTNEMSVYGYFSPTTQKHINDFLEFYGFDMCNKKQLEIMEKLTFENSYSSSRSGFSHTSRLYFNNQFVAEYKASYINRTWEAYTYQTAMKGAVRNAIDLEVLDEKKKRGIKRLTKELREVILLESEFVQLLKEKLKTL